MRCDKHSAGAIAVYVVVIFLEVIMKQFKCADGTLINPANVTCCHRSRSEGKHIVRFNFVGGSARELLFNRENQAINQMIDYEQHCEKI
jgi:hypothetical protein